MAVYFDYTNTTDITGNTAAGYLGVEVPRHRGGLVASD